MKLIKPPYPDTTDTGVCYWSQTGNRKTAIDLAVAALRELPAFDTMSEAMREWAIEAVAQGAWVREYHKWETDTKSYFCSMHLRNGVTAPNWKKLDGSHVEKIEKQLALFSATPPATIAVIEENRGRVNDTKHDDSYLAGQSDYEFLVSAISQFWEDLAAQETFTPPDQKP